MLCSMKEAVDPLEGGHEGWNMMGPTLLITLLQTSLPEGQTRTV